MNLIIWTSILFKLFPHETVHKGDKFIVLFDLKVNAIAHFKTPYIDYFICLLPKGTILVANSDKFSISSAFSCVPENKYEIDKRFVPEKIRVCPDYVGSSFELKFKYINNKIKRYLI